MAAWYFDLISPFSWLALPEVEALPAQVEYRPVLLGAVLKHWGQLGPAEIVPKRLPTYRLCVWLAAERGIPFRMPPVHPFNPLRAMRLLTALGAERATVRAAMETVWAEGRDVSEPGGFAALASRLRVTDPDGLIEAQGGRDKLRASTEGAIARGVFGVPTLEVGGELFWGLDAMPLARAALADPGLLTRGEMGRLATITEAQRQAPAR
ncbi:MAG TPA: 2-hydroxychromene-2-carboxylate isomerase [Acetobacteraceae bacterium]|nr:2-hydroxychromene-2-carboxylate isomerase [Acetobacteraceae bacterium]